MIIYITVQLMLQCWYMASKPFHVMELRIVHTGLNYHIYVPIYHWYKEVVNISAGMRSNINSTTTKNAAEIIIAVTKFYKIFFRLHIIPFGKFCHGKTIVKCIMHIPYIRQIIRGENFCGSSLKLNTI